MKKERMVTPRFISIVSCLLLILIVSRCHTGSLVSCSDEWEEWRFFTPITNVTTEYTPNSREGILASATLDDMVYFVGYLDDSNCSIVGGQSYNYPSTSTFLGKMDLTTGDVIKIVQIGIYESRSWAFSNIYIDQGTISVTVSVYCNGSAATECKFMVDNSTVDSVTYRAGYIFVGQFTTELKYLGHKGLENQDGGLYSHGLVSFQSKSADEQHVYILASYKCPAAATSIIIDSFTLNCQGGSTQTALIVLQNLALVERITNYVSEPGYCKPGGLAIDTTSGDLYISMTASFSEKFVRNGEVKREPGYLIDSLIFLEIQTQLGNSTFLYEERNTTTAVTSLVLGKEGFYLAGTFKGSPPFASGVSYLGTSGFVSYFTSSLGVMWTRVLDVELLITDLPTVIQGSGADGGIFLSVSTSSQKLIVRHPDGDIIRQVDLSGRSYTWIVFLTDTGTTTRENILEGNQGQVYRSLSSMTNSLLISGSFSNPGDYSGRGAFIGEWNYSPICDGGCHNGTCERDNYCNCDQGYLGNDCLKILCFGVLSEDPAVCSGKGVCEGPDTCDCYPGYSGLVCAFERDPFEIIVSSNGSEISCMIPSYYPEILSGIPVFNFTWLFIQNGIIAERVPIVGPLASVYSPTPSKIHNGAYSIVGELYYEVLGKTRFRNLTETGFASCSICFSMPSINCRYSLTLSNNIKNESITSINRMKSYEVALVNQDLAINNVISGLQLEWLSSINSRKTNIQVTSSNYSNSFILSPLDSTGMNPIDINITLRLKIPFLEWQVISFKLKILASKDITPINTIPLTITPQEGYSLTDNFGIHATNWVGSRLIYSFSYLDLFTGEYVRLGESTSSSITTVLPPGNHTNSGLSVRVKVLDPDNGDFGSAEQKIIVKPSFVAGLLSQKLDESIESGNYTTTLTIASQIRGATIEEIEANSSELKDVVRRILDYTATRVVPDSVSVEQQLLVVDMITKNHIIMSNQDKGTALDIALNIINIDRANISISFVSSSGYQKVTNIISNVAQNGFTNRTVAEQAVQTGENLAKLIASGLFVGESPSMFVATNFKLTVVVDQTSSIVNKSIQTNGGTIDSFYIPVQFTADVGEDAVSSSILVFQDNPYEIRPDGTPSGVSSPVIDIKFNNLDGAMLAVANLTQPLLIHFNRTKAKQQGACPEATFQCRYWSELEHSWKTDGCYWIDNENEDYISCACNHTTSFSAFVLEKGDSCVAYAGIKITGIVFNSMYFITCIPILIGLFLISQQQPMRSRFIAPFIGISAIIVDSVVQGLIRNSLSLARKQDASDAFSYVIMLTANPLFVTALFVFLWQQVRFLLMQNIYYLMPSANNSFQKKFIRLNRILASKALFLIVTLCVGSLVLACFAVLVGFAAHYNNTGAVEKRNTVVIVQAVSFAAMLILVSLGILFTLIVDIVYSVKQESASKKTFEDHASEHNQQVHVKKTKGLGLMKKHFINDPLLFRTESVIIVIAVFVIIVLYSIGIATIIEMSRAKSPIMIVRTVIEIILMFTRIFAFGGFIFVVSVKSMIRGRQINSQYEQLSTSMSSKETVQDQKVLDILRHSSGYHLVFDFCRKEFSLENILLWKELESIRSRNLLMTTEERQKVLKEIQELYIDNNSERQLNISNQQRKGFLRVAKMSEPSAADAEEAFAKLYGACMMNIADTLTRLSSTEAYQTYELAKETSNELRDDFFGAN